MEPSRLDLMIDVFVRSMCQRRDLVAGRMITREWRTIASIARTIGSGALVYGIFELSNAASACGDGMDSGTDAVRRALVDRLLVAMDMVISGSLR